MYKEYEDLVFYLSNNSNESINDIKRMSHGERVGFQQRLFRALQDKAKSSQGGSKEPE